VYESYDRLVAAWGVDAEQRDLETSYGKTHAILAGDPSAPPLLLFHGVGDDSAVMWVRTAAGLASRFRLIAVDTMGGAGKSVPDERYRRGFDTARWQTDVMDALGIGRASAAGVSYGSYMVQLLAIRHPERLDRAVGMSGALFCAGARRKSLGRMLRVLLPAVLPFGGGRERAFEALTGPKRAEVIAAVPGLKEHWDLARAEYRSASQRFHKRAEFTDEEIASLRGRCLFIIGGEDALFYEQAMEGFERYGVRHVVMDGAGHALNAEEPEATNGFIVDFLSERREGGAAG